MRPISLNTNESNRTVSLNLYVSQITMTGILAACAAMQTTEVPTLDIKSPFDKIVEAPTINLVAIVLTNGSALVRMYEHLIPAALNSLTVSLPSNIGLPSVTIT